MTVSLSSTTCYDLDQANECSRKPSQ